MHNQRATLGVDSSYHIQSSMSVRRGIIWDISIHNIRKGEGLFEKRNQIKVVCAFKKGTKKLEVNIDV